MLCAGARGYVHKTSATRQIIEALRAVRDGKWYLSEALSSRLLGRLVGGNVAEQLSPLEQLGDRELETFVLLGQGLTTQEIAQRMHVSHKTVDTYRTRVKEKLQLNNSTQLLHRAIQWTLEQRQSNLALSGVG